MSKKPEHLVGCPAMDTEGGPKGPCVCTGNRKNGPRREPRARWVPRRPTLELVLPPEPVVVSASRVKRVKGPTRDQTQAAAQILRVAKLTWADVREWCEESGWTDPGGWEVKRGVINPRAVAAHMQALREDPGMVSGPVKTGVVS